MNPKLLELLQQVLDTPDEKEANRMTTMTKTYLISTPDGSQDRRLRAEYHSIGAAAAALAAVMGWRNVVLSEQYSDTSINGCECSSWSAYETKEECDADVLGAHVPRITEITQHKKEEEP